MFTCFMDEFSPSHLQMSEHNPSLFYHGFIVSITVLYNIDGPQIVINNRIM